MTICTEPDVLEAAGIAEEAGSGRLMRRFICGSFCASSDRNRNSVYLLADTQQSGDVGGSDSEYQEICNSGRGTYEILADQPERLVND